MGDWFDDGASGAPVDVVALLDSDVPKVIGEVVALGALVSLGTTSDGGALAVTVTQDGRWRRQYVRDGEALLAFVLEALDAVRNAGASRPASPAAASRRRGTRGR